MPSAKKLYPGGKNFKAADLKGPLTARISAVDSRTLKEGEDEKLVLTLDGQDKSFVLNSTNAGVLIERYGDDYTQWVGKSITIASVPTQYQGQNTNGIRIIG